MPMKRAEFCWLKVERSDGRSFSASPMLAWPWSGSSSALIEVIGTGEVRLGRRMREPVTTMPPPLIAGGAGSVDARRAGARGSLCRRAGLRGVGGRLRRIGSRLGGGSGGICGLRRRGKERD